MATPITIVDDSTMSRKLMIRALPKNWDVEISQAQNGQEAMEAYHQGKADIMFLDLTMPVMDGYQVLETLQKTGLNSFVIVVSADIQPKAQERVMQMGAMAFLKKPVNTEEVTAVLTEYGII
ncbi:MAG: response regulator [Gammaproteobacteria bacterium]|nr:response regulator [Gammaproteobacteria bacterium]